MHTNELFKPRGTIDCPIAFNEYNPRVVAIEPYPHCHNELELLICQKGSINVLIKQQRFHLLPGYVLIVAPMEDHGIEKPEHDALLWHLIFPKEVIEVPGWHIFSKEFVEPVFSNKLHPPRLLQPEHPAYQDVMGYIQQLPSGRLNQPGYKLRRYVLAVSICSALVPYCTSDESIELENLPKNITVRKLVRYIHNHLVQPMTLEELARHTNLQPNYMCALFKQHMNESIFSFILRRRVEYAAVLLRSQELAVGDIAGKAGFTSESSFYRKFKEHFGVTPLAYRKAYRK